MTLEGVPYWVMTRGTALAAAVSLSLVLATSKVSFDLWAVTGPPAVGVVIAYIVLMVAIAFRPLSYRLHLWAAPLCTIVFLGRGGGFLRIVVDADRPDLIGAVSERVAMWVFVLGYHLYLVFLSGMIGSGEHASHIKDPDDVGTP